MSEIRDSLAQVQASIETLASAKDKLMAFSDERKAVWRVIELFREHGPALLAMMEGHSPDAGKMGEAEEGSLRFIAKRNLRRMIEIGSTDKVTMLLCLEELS